MNFWTGVRFSSHPPVEGLDTQSVLKSCADLKSAARPEGSELSGKAPKKGQVNDLVFFGGINPCKRAGRLALLCFCGLSVIMFKILILILYTNIILQTCHTTDVIRGEIICIIKF